MSHPNTDRDERVRRAILDVIRGSDQWLFYDRRNGHAQRAEFADQVLLLLNKQTAASVSQTPPLLQRIVQIADMGSAEEFGDALERLRAIRGLIIGENSAEGIIDHLMSLAEEKCVACIANNARMAIDIEHTCELRHATIEAAANTVEGGEDG